MESSDRAATRPGRAARRTRSLALALLLGVPSAAWAKTVLVFGPHPDDETLIAAGRVRSAVSAGDTVKVVVVTNGDATGTQAGLRREAESVAAAQVLGLTEQDVIFLGYPDGSLLNIYNAGPSTVITSQAGQTATYGNRGLGGMDYHRYLYGVPGPYSRATALGDFVALLTQFPPDEIYTLRGDLDAHEDHRATGRFVQAALDQLQQSGAALNVRLYQTIVWDPQTSWNESSWPNVGGFTPALPFQKPDSIAQSLWDQRVTFTVPLEMQSLTASSNMKYQAIAAYPSQDSPWLFSFARLDEFYWETDYGSPQADQPPATPGSPAAAAQSSTSIQVTWAASAGAASYLVERAPDAGGSPGAWGAPAVVPASPLLATALLDGGLTPSTLYWYRVAASNSAGTSAYGAAVSAATPAPPPPPPVPGSPAAAAVSSTSIQVSWAASSGATSYKVQRAPDAGGAPGAWGAAATATASPYLSSGLTASTTYWYRVAASNAAGDSAYGAAVGATTQAPPLQRPAAPGSPAAAALSSSSIQVTWAASAGATSYKVQRAPNRNGRPGTWGTATAVAASPFVSTGLSASTRYWYRVAASNAAGDSSYSSSVSATTLAPAAQPPATPANPAATAVSSTSIQVTWSASSGATGYRVQRAPDASGAPGTWGAAVSDTASPFADSGLAAGTRYWYRVAASNAAGDSAYGAAVSATTLPAPLPPATPASPAATAVSSTSIQVTWSASSGATGYKVQRAPDASGAPGTWAAAVSVAASPFLDSGLAAGTRYWYRVAASNAAGDSAYGAAVSATTQAAGGNLATFGKTTAGSDAVWFPIGPNSISLCRFALPRAGQVTKLSVRFAEQLTGHWRGVIYRAGAANAPTTLVAQSNEIAATAVGWVDLTFAAPVALAAGDYYLGVMGDDGVQVDADVAGDNVYADASYAAGAPATWSTSGQSVSSYQKPIYATYTY